MMGRQPVELLRWRLALHSPSYAPSGITPPFIAGGVFARPGIRIRDLWNALSSKSFMECHWRLDPLKGATGAAVRHKNP
jgi:hypothetical protein